MLRDKLKTRAAALLLSLLFPAMSPASALGLDYWHTHGNQILDSKNHPVRIAGVTWSGFEAPDAVVHGLWAQDYRSILKAIRQNGYNAIRIPYSNQMVEANPKPVNISFSNATGPINTDLKGLTSLEILDKIIDFAGAIGLRVILDNHRSEAGTSAEANGLWYTNEFPEQAWIRDW
ncbi:MAG TPA: cellulase family glycosylhydrolase, partial [Candidatus Angelobacter sp.]